MVYDALPFAFDSKKGASVWVRCEGRRIMMDAERKGDTHVLVILFRVREAHK